MEEATLTRDAPRIDATIKYQPARPTEIRMSEVAVHVSLPLSTWYVILSDPPAPRDAGRGELAELAY